MAARGTSTARRKSSKKKGGAGSTTSEGDWLTEAVGQRIRSLRHQRGLTMEELADRVGVPTETVGRVERAAQSPTLRMLQRLAGGLGVEPVVLLWSDLVPVDYGLDRVPPEAREIVAELVGRTPGDLDRVRQMLALMFGSERRDEGPA